jgi:hypothetical protein
MHQSFWQFAVRAIAAVILTGLTMARADAGMADVEKVEIAREAGGSYRFDVTVRHADEGWDHYADRWDVVAPDGSVIASRTLYHPHVEEQPFTRSLDGVKIPEGVTTVRIRAHDKVHGLGGKTMDVIIPE